MSRNQRLSFLGIAAVIAVVAIVFFAAGSGPEETAEDADRQTSQQQEETPTPSPGPEGTATETPEPTPTPRPKPPLLQSGEVTRLRFTEGETVRFRARSANADHVHVHGYDLLADVAPGRMARITFTADVPGRFEIELEDRGEPIAELRVTP
jgi:hypothetical protein